MKSIVNYVYSGDTILINTFSILCELRSKDYDIFSLQIDENIRNALINVQNNPDSAVVHNKVKLLYSDLTDLDFEKNTCFCVTIECAQTEKIVMDIGFSGVFKLWVNNKPICVGMELQQRKFIELILKKGENEVIIEYINQKGNSVAQGYIQLYNYKDVLSGNIFPLLDKIISKNSIEVISQYNSDEGILEYMLLCPPEVIVQAENVNLDIPEVEEVELRGMTKYTVNLEQYKEEIFHFGLIISGEDRFISLAVNLPEKKLSELYDMADQYENEWDQKSGITIRGIRKKLMKMYLPKKRRYDLVKILYNILNHLPVHTNRKYFISDIDNSVQEVIVKEPDGYDENIFYPLVLYLVDKEESFFSENVSHCNEYVIADFYCGGILGGGYMSEARYFEVLDYLFSNYNIDKNRIYLIGQSHSSYDLWFLLENYPDLAAAAFLISGSPRYDNIMNVSNQPITNVLSNYDYNYLHNIGTIKDILNSDKYHEIRCKNIISASLSDFTLYSIKEFFDGKSKEKYPDEIHFRTDMNRYLRSYWINSYGISYEKTYLTIHAKILSNERIEIEAENTVGFRIELPPFINKKRFVVTVNHEAFLFEEYDKDYVIFLGIENRFSEVSEWAWPIDYRKGIGILDVYSAPLRIFIPESHSKIVNETAEKFASPLTNGVIGAFDVNYPIDSIQNFDVNQNSNHNIIFINVDSNVLCMDQYYGTCLEIPIKTDAKYFQYKETRYFGEYCVLQIIPNPYNNERSILLIHTNNEKLLARNFLTRNVIIPFMFNGFHPFYHNEAVIMYEKRYYAIYEWDNEITEI